jgi:hypothetical protein
MDNFNPHFLEIRPERATPLNLLFQAGNDYLHPLPLQMSTEGQKMEFCATRGQRID